VASRIGSYLLPLDRGYTAYFYGGTRHAYGTHPGGDFLSRRLPVQNMDDPFKPSFADGPPDLPNPGAGATFLAVPERAAELAKVEARYPGGRRQEIADCGQVVLLVYELPPAHVY
jgi:hypothetical protein